MRRGGGALIAVGAALGLLTVFGEDDAGFLAAVDLGFPGELAAEQVDGAALLAEGGGQAEDVDEQAAVQLRAGRVFVDLVERQKAFAALRGERFLRGIFLTSG